MVDSLRRRDALGLALGGVTACTLGSGWWTDLLAGAATTARVDAYGRLRAPDAHGLRLPPGFKVRLIARGGDRVPGTRYRWHADADGAATFRVDDGFVLVSNSEREPDGGASAIRFDRRGRIRDAYRILGGTRRNCSGGGTPWGTWLSCEEVDDGLVWECDPLGRWPPVARPALGCFNHEAAAVDPRDRHVYLTEDVDDGNLYRFTPTRWPDLSDGLLEAAIVRRGGWVDWAAVPDPSGRSRPTRQQVAGAARFARAEGIWFDAGTVYIATTADSRIHALKTRTGRLKVIYDGEREPGRLLTHVDAIAVSPEGQLIVCEDNDQGRLDIGVAERSGRVSRLLSASGPRHAGSELTGITFDPGGTRLFFASQRAAGVGEIYELRGPFSS